MLSHASVVTVLPASDPNRAATFYRDTLGLQDLGDVPDGNRALRTSAGAMIELLPSDEGAQSNRTVASFEVPDVAAEVAELESRGVRFADYDMPNLKTVDHIAELGSDKAAWFSDTEGNILCLHQAQH